MESSRRKTRAKIRSRILRSTSPYDIWNIGLVPPLCVAIRAKAGFQAEKLPRLKGTGKVMGLRAF